jgi:hypothetical protein
MFVFGLGKRQSNLATTTRSRYLYPLEHERLLSVIPYRYFCMFCFSLEFLNPPVLINKTKQS